MSEPQEKKLQIVSKFYYNPKLNDVKPKETLFMCTIFYYSLFRKLQM